MKVAVSIPDPVFAEAELLAKRLGTTRSDLYARALDAYVGTHAPDRVTEAMNAALDQMGGAPDGTAPAEFAAAAARRVFSRVEW